MLSFNRIWNISTGLLMLPAAVLCTYNKEYRVLVFAGTVGASSVTAGVAYGLSAGVTVLLASLTTWWGGVNLWFLVMEPHLHSLIARVTRKRTPPTWMVFATAALRNT